MATEQAQEAATAAEAAAVNTDAGNNAQTQDSSPETLESLLEQMSAPAPADAASEEVAEEETGATEESEEAETEAGETSGEEEAAEEESTGATEEQSLNPKAKNIRVNVSHITDPKEVRVMQLVRKGATPTEAFRAVYGAEPGTQQQAQEAAPDPITEIDAELGQLDQQITELDQKIAEAQFDQEEQAALRKQQRELERKVGKLEALKESAATQRQSAEEQAAVSEVQQSFQKALKDYPDAFTDEGNGQYVFDTSTDVGFKAKAEYEYLRATDSPLLNNPKHLEIILARVGGKPKAASASPSPAAKQTPATPPVQPKRGVRPVATGGNQPSNPSADAIMQKAIQSGSLDDLQRAMAALGTQIRP